MSRSSLGAHCPAPLEHDTVQLAHGGGGRLMRRLIEEIFYAALGAPAAADRHDSFTFEVPSGRMALTTDAYVVSPREFPGGDIGTLAVHGTVNDLAMAGAEPRYLSAAFVLEEGLPLDELRSIVQSMALAAREAGVRIVTGDTKVVDRGRGHGVFITTSGVGFVREGVQVAPTRINGGDAVLLSGDVGRHGVAVLSVRDGLGLEGAAESDCAPLWPQVRAMLNAGIDVHCLRDLTRGGLAAALNEIALDASLDLEIDETCVGVHEAVAGACEIYGLDPLYVANEGRFVAFVSASQSDAALDALRAAGATGAVRIGEVSATGKVARRRVRCRGTLGQIRYLDLLSGEQLPRIC